MNRRRFLTLFGVGLGVGALAAIPAAMSLPRQRMPALIVGQIGSYDDVPIWTNGVEEFYQGGQWIDGKFQVLTLKKESQMYNTS